MELDKNNNANYMFMVKYSKSFLNIIITSDMVLINYITFFDFHLTEFRGTSEYIHDFSTLL